MHMQRKLHMQSGVTRALIGGIYLCSGRLISFEMNLIKQPVHECSSAAWV